MQTEACANMKAGQGGREGEEEGNDRELCMAFGMCKRWQRAR